MPGGTNITALRDGMHCNGGVGCMRAGEFPKQVDFVASGLDAINFVARFRVLGKEKRKASEYSGKKSGNLPRGGCK